MIYAQFSARNPSKACLNNDLFILKYAVNIQCEMCQRQYAVRMVCKCAVQSE